MPLVRKREILGKIESSEGVNANPGSSDAAQVYNPTSQDTVQVIERVPAGQTLSTDFVPIGQKRRQFTFDMDFRGSADTTIPIVEPDWAASYLKTCAYQATSPVTVPVTSITGTGFQVGEIVQKSSTIRGVVIGCFTGGTTLTHRLTANGNVIIAPLQGVFTSTGTLTGESSGTTATIGTVAAYAGLVYQPTSQKLMNVTTGAWAASTPTAGDVLTVKNGSVVVGHCQLIADNSAGAFTNIDVTILDGTISNGNTLVDGANSATVNAVPTMKLTPSMTIRGNFDGRRRDGVGCRGNFVLKASAQEPGVFTFTMEGDPVAASDALATGSSSLGSVRDPRFVGAIAAYGKKVDTTNGDAAVDFFRLPTKSFELNAGNTVSPNADANGSGGTTGSNVTDRRPKLKVVSDQVHSAFDWEAHRDNSQAVRSAIILGTVQGNIVGLVVPNGQVTAAPQGDANGVATFEVEISPRRNLVSGDDEVFLFQL